jgi:hypothetical protein
MAINSTKTRLRLKGVITCSFARSEATNLNLYRTTPSYPGDLKKGEAFLFLSKTGNQIIFVFHAVALEEEDGKIREVIDSRRLRLPHGATWHPYMLQNYAEEVGIHLIGIKSFKDIYEDRRKAKRAPPKTL